MLDCDGNGWLLGYFIQYYIYESYIYIYLNALQLTLIRHPKSQKSENNKAQHHTERLEKDQSS